ncbi:hypothetical protein [Streptomyces sp. NRRL S-920]|uniref:hypothetical protein n=1 Tax=Streptomyces sp. NRRL S-920 TaxID=1463921 RepID=UPI00131EB4E3|nr:hypothetical protein [Streptomyces sp. NRRL S-920]
MRRRRAALLLCATCVLGLLPVSAGADPAVPPVPPVRRAPATAAAPVDSCTAADLPAAAPARAARARAARAVLACFKAAVPGGRSPRGATLRATGLTVTAMYCPLGSDVCRAASVTLDNARIGYQGSGRAPGSCTAARRITLSGDVRFAATWLRGRVFGLLPMALSTAALPPLPLPYLYLSDVHATGLWARADHATTDGTTIGPGQECAPGPPQAGVGDDARLNPIRDAGSPAN